MEKILSFIAKIPEERIQTEETTTQFQISGQISEVGDTAPNLVASNRGDIRNKDLQGEVTEIVVCKAVPDVVYTVVDGTMYVSRDRARTWQDLSRSAGRIAVDPGDPATVYVLLGNGIHVSNDYGNTWHINSQIPRHFPIGGGGFEVHFLNPRVLISSNYTGIFISTDQGKSWTSHFTEPSINGTAPWWFAISEQDEGSIVAVTYQKQFYRSNDFGDSWSLMNPPLLTDGLRPGIFGPLVFEPGTSTVWYGDLGDHDSSPRRMLFYTSNWGETWDFTFEDAYSKVLIDYIEFVESDGKYVLYVASPSSAYFSPDRGENWHLMQIQFNGLPHGVTETSFLNCNLVNAYTKDGLIYLKTNAGLLKSIDNGSIWYY